MTAPDIDGFPCVPRRKHRFYRPIDTVETADSRFNTQVQRSQREYLDEPSEIGRSVGNNTRELFVSCEPAEALQQQIDYLRPSYIALHDVGARGAKKLLHAVASAAGRPVERLTVRRQSYGTTLAHIDHVDCLSVNGRKVRLYSTDIDADTPSRHALARVLLGRATLAVVLIGDVPPHALSDALQPLREHLFSRDWQCNHLQIMPLSGSSQAAMTGLVGALGLGGGIECQIAPLVSRPAEAWTYVSGAWNRLQGLLHPDGSGPLLSPMAPGRDVLVPMPDTGVPRNALAAQVSPMDHFVLEAHALAGVLAACIFDIATRRLVAHAGASVPGGDLARRGSMLLAAGSSSRRQLHLVGQADEVLVMGGTDALGVRTLLTQPGLGVHVVYNPTQTSWTQLRPRLMALDAALPRAPVL